MKDLFVSGIPTYWGDVGIAKMDDGSILRIDPCYSKMGWVKVSQVFADAFIKEFEDKDLDFCCVKHPGDE